MPAILKRLLIPCYCHFLDRKVMCFFSRTTHVHIRLLRHNVLLVAYNNCPGPQESQISRQLNTVGHDKAGTCSFCQNHCRIATRVQDAWNNLSQDDIQHIYDRLHARIHACVAAEWDTLCIDASVWASLTVTCVSFGLNLLSYTPTTINYMSHQFAIRGICPWGCCIFSQ